MADTVVFKKAIEDILPEDYRFIKREPDPEFSPARNKAVMQKCIEKTDKYFATLHKLDDETLNRLDIVNTYGVRRIGGGTTKSFKDYVGRKLFEQLIGEKIMSKVRLGDTIARMNRAAGNDKYQNFILD